jgi:hypothetical protein
MERGRLGTYLNDHLAGAAAALQLLERLEKTQAEPQFANAMRDVRLDVETDRLVLTTVLERVGGEPSGAKQAAGRLAERIARVKLEADGDSGSFARFESLEVLGLGILGKRSLWRALAALDDAALGAFDFAALEARAERQFARVERERLRLAPFAFCAAASATDAKGSS